jgi:hypothetical protein
MPEFHHDAWVEGAPLAERRVAIVSSAGLVVRGDRVFRGRDADYRAIPATTAPNDLLCSHISINFDRTGFGGGQHSARLRWTYPHQYPRCQRSITASTRSEWAKWRLEQRRPLSRSISTTWLVSMTP